MLLSRREVRRAQSADPSVQRRESLAVSLSRISTFLVYPLVLSIQVGNAFWWHRFDAFLLALFWGLTGCSIGFVGLIQALYRR